MGLNEGRLSYLPLLTWLPLINQRSKTDTSSSSLFARAFTLISTVLNVKGFPLGSGERGQPHNKHKGALSAGENVVYRLCYNGLVVAGSHAHFLIFNSHAISFWEKTELRGFAVYERDASQLIFWADRLPYPLPALYPLFPSLVALLYLCRISSDGRADTGCVASQTCSGCQTERLPALRSVSSPRQWELFDLTERLH